MATLVGRSPKETYGNLLQVDNANVGIDATLRAVSDGEGTPSILDLSTTDARFRGDVEITGALNISTLTVSALDGVTIDNSVIGGTTPAAGTFTTLNATGGGALTGTWSDLGTITTVDINGGTITGITDLAVADGGTGSSTAAGARTNLGVAIGSNVQAYDAGLNSIAGLVTAADRMIYTTASDTYAVATLTAAGRAILDDADASAQRTTLGLGTIATQAASSVAITGGTINGVAGTFTTVGGTTITASTSFRGTDFGSGSTSDVNVTTLGGNQFRAKHRASAVNVFAVQGSTTGNDVFLFTEGSDTNIDIAWVLKGAAQMLTYNAGGGTLLTTLNSAGDFPPWYHGKPGSRVGVSGVGQSVRSERCDRLRRSVQGQHHRHSIRSGLHQSAAPSDLYIQGQNR
jgi:hypothetical protein